MKNVTRVIEESKADVAKIDCEGAEDCLVTVPSVTLRKIKMYIIEVHSSEIRDRVLRHFSDSGFRVIKETDPVGSVSIISFELEREAISR